MVVLVRSDAAGAEVAEKLWTTIMMSGRPAGANLSVSQPSIQGPESSETNLIKNLNESQQPSLPKGSFDEPARQAVEKAMRQDRFEDQGMPAQKWAKLVVQDLLKKNPPSVIWRGKSAWLTRLAAILPFGMLDGVVKKLTGLDVVERTQILQADFLR